MKIRLLFLAMAAALIAASVGLTSCSKEDGDVPGGVNSNFVGTWVCDHYYVGTRDNLLYPMGDLYDLPLTTVVLNSNGTCSGSGIVINGNGSYTVQMKDYKKDDNYSVLTFTQNGKVVCTATLKTYTNDHKKGWVRLSGYDDKTFIFLKQ